MTINPIHTNASSLDLTQSMGSRNAQSQNSGLSSTQTSDEILVQNPDMAKVFQFMEQMQQLQTSDPGKFKSVMSKLSDKLKTPAGNSTDGAEKQFLTTLSDSFAESAKSGKLEMPKPPEGAGQAGMYGPAPKDQTSGSGASSLFQSGSDLQSLLAKLMDQITQDTKSSNRSSTDATSLK
jgi:hypothetical protein